MSLVASTLNAVSYPLDRVCVCWGAHAPTRNSSTLILLDISYIEVAAPRRSLLFTWSLLFVPATSLIVSLYAHILLLLPSSPTPLVSQSFLPPPLSFCLLKQRKKNGCR
jgi:hypothetical protein